MPNTRVITDEELLQLPKDGHKYEVVDGELRVSPAGLRHERIVPRRRPASIFRGETPLGRRRRIVVSDLVRERPIWFGGTDRSEASMDEFFKWLGAKQSGGQRPLYPLWERSEWTASG